jgi:hypothetical protein
MVETRKHSLSFAAGLSGLNKSQFCKFLQNNQKITAHTLESLSKKQARQYSKALKNLYQLRWKIAIIIDSTVQSRSSLKSENVQKFGSGKGFVVGHQWTNIIMVINGIIIPMPPIPFYSKKYCKENGIEYKTEHKRIAEYLGELKLEEYIGFHKSEDVAVLADSGYDVKMIQNAAAAKGWDFIIALKCSRGLKSEAEYAKTRKASRWNRAAEFFKKQRRLAWETVCIFPDTQKKKRKEFRVRHTEAWLKGVGKIRAVCSEFKRRRNGRKRKFIACSNLKASPEQILRGYEIRWKIEIFHKEIKMHFGFEDIAAKYFGSVESHVSMVYCAYILMYANPPGVPEGVRSVSEKQQYTAAFLENKKTASVLQKLTQIGGEEHYKNDLKSALTNVEFCKPMFGNYARV